MSMFVRYLLTAILAYLLGSVSSGVLISRITGNPDPRTLGSKSSGATNSLRTMGAKVGVAVLVCDALKAFIACFVGWLLVDRVAAAAFPPYGRMLAAFFVIVGHIWPVFFQFKGGKGVVCIMAAMLTCFPLPAAICILFGVLLVVITRYVSLGSISGVLLYALFSIFWFGQGNWIVMVWACFLPALIIYCHRTNVVRLLHGKENKFGQKAK